MNKLFTMLAMVFFSMYSSARDTIIVHKDPRLDLLTAKQASVNKLTSRMTSSGHYRGYRLQVLSTRSREDAFTLKTKLLKEFPEQRTYILYQSPYFKVRIGNFINRSDAEDFKDEITLIHPLTAYIVPDIIEYTPGEFDALEE